MLAISTKIVVCEAAQLHTQGEEEESKQLNSITAS